MKTFFRKFDQEAFKTAAGTAFYFYPEVHRWLNIESMQLYIIYYTYYII